MSEPRHPANNPTDNAPEHFKGDNPEAYLALDRRVAIHTGVEIPNQVTGSALFADISGFTPLTEALQAQHGPQRGSEELTRHLDRVFHAIIEALNRFGGNVIYFAGDAITCWLDQDDGQRAIAAGIAMQAAINESGKIPIGSEKIVQLGMKVTVARGHALRGVVGDPDIQYIDVLAGDILDDLATAEQLAEVGEVLADESVLSVLGDQVKLSSNRRDEETGLTVGIVDSLLSEVPDCPETPPPPLPVDKVKQWSLPPVYERLTTGRGEFTAELRPAYPVFLRFSGLDFDKATVLSELNDFVVSAQRIFDGFGGNVLQLVLGDKGAYLYGVFGSPIAHEDDASRATAAALQLLKLNETTVAEDIQIGIAHGNLLSGTYGHQMRRTFVCLGDSVNLSARLMGKAPAGGILVAPEVREATGYAFVWKDIEPLKLKGKEKPVAASELKSSLVTLAGRNIRFELPMVGRVSEMQLLTRALAAAEQGQCQVAAISAEAGLGKSRLIAEFVRQVRRRGKLVVFGECQSYSANTPYFVWQEIWHRLLGLDEASSEERQIELLEQFLNSVDPLLVPRAPLFADVLGLSIADTPLTTSFDSKIRKASLEDLLATCLQYRASQEPIVIVLEDTHWIDPLSRDLLEALVRASLTRQVLFVPAYRGATEPGGDLALENLPGFQEVLLEELQGDDMRAVIATKAYALFQTEELPESFLSIIIKRTQGNPFYIEEILNFVAAQDIDISNPYAFSSLQLPDSLNSLILSRIDSLAEEQRRTLKIASVIGRQFQGEMLQRVYPELGEINFVLDQLQALQRADLVNLDQVEQMIYLFKHMITREVSYNSLPYAIRAQLHHQAGEYIERTEADHLDKHLDLLAHHFWNSDDKDRKIKYLGLAAESASYRYANRTAIEYGNRLSSLLEGEALSDNLIKLARVYGLTGDWEQAGEKSREALEIATAVGNQLLVARSLEAIAEVDMHLGAYDEAGRQLNDAIRIFRQHNDRRGESTANHLNGRIFLRLGKYDEAIQAFEYSLAIYRELKDLKLIASAHNNLAMVADEQGNVEAARFNTEKALEIRQQLDDRWGIALSLTNLSVVLKYSKDYDLALEKLDEAGTLAREVGDPGLYALSQENAGDIFRTLGKIDDAKNRYAICMHTYSSDDLRSLVYMFENIAILASLAGEHEVAVESFRFAGKLRDQVGLKLGDSWESEIMENLSQSIDQLGQQRAGELESEVQQWSVSEATDHVLGFLGPA